MNQPFPDIEGFVLAGGASRRMGTDKCLLEIDGETLLERACAALAVTARTRVVGRAPDVMSMSKATQTFVHDVYRARDGSAPRCALAGLHAALWHAESEWVAVLACDLPFVTPELVARLASLRVSQPHADAVVPRQADGRLQPLCALYRRAAVLRRATDALDANDYAMNSFVAHLETREVNFSELSDLPGASRFFVNVNTPEEHEKAKGERRKAKGESYATPSA